MWGLFQTLFAITSFLWLVWTGEDKPKIRGRTLPESRPQNGRLYNKTDVYKRKSDSYSRTENIVTKLTYGTETSIILSGAETFSDWKNVCFAHPDTTIFNLAG